MCAFNHFAFKNIVFLQFAREGFVDLKPLLSQTYFGYYFIMVVELCN